MTSDDQLIPNMSNYVHYYIFSLSGDEREAGRAKPAMKKLE